MFLCSGSELDPGYMTGLTFLRGVGFLALGTSLCLPFFTKGLVESKGLWAILSCCQGGFFCTKGCFWTTGSPPPTSKKSFRDFLFFLFDLMSVHQWICNSKLCLSHAHTLSEHPQIIFTRLRGSHCGKSQVKSVSHL